MDLLGLESFQSLYEDLGDLMNQGFRIFNRNKSIAERRTKNEV